MLAKLAKVSEVDRAKDVMKAGTHATPSSPTGSSTTTVQLPLEGASRKAPLANGLDQLPVASPKSDVASSMSVELPLVQLAKARKRPSIASLAAGSASGSGSGKPKKIIEKTQKIDVPLIGMPKPTLEPTTAKHAVWKKSKISKQIYEKVWTNVASEKGENPRWVPLTNITGTNAKTSKVEVALIGGKKKPTKKAASKGKLPGEKKKLIWAPFRDRMGKVVSDAIKQHIWVPIKK
jgi:hypothetical protein